MTALRATLVAFVALAVLAGASPAHAASGALYGVQDDAWLGHGPGTLESRLDELDRLGVDVVRFTVRWDPIATERPTAARDAQRPAYDWRTTDAVLRGLRRHGIEPVVTLYGTPRWANGGLAPNWAPTSERMLRRLRARSRHAVPVGAPVGDLERAEPPAVAPADVGARPTSGSS